MPLPNHCIECDKPVDENSFSNIICSRCAEAHFEATTADIYNELNKKDDDDKK